MTSTNDVIALLPDSVANQIAAGEVIQRPASVVKELVENAVDAGATEITVLVKDAGRTLVQVIDNGKGMSCTDARMAFERHATSKIRKADDLFSLHTMGFRGEALASIAAVAQVELITKRSSEEMATKICISGTKIESQEAIAGNTGACFSVKNLFFNVPARRKFLKSNQTELSNIMAEFERIALVNTDIAFTLRHNDTDLFRLPPVHLRQRIVSIFGKGFNQQLLNVEVNTDLVKIHGYISHPQAARKRGAVQYLFVNNRYMRHPYFHKAILHNYEALIPQGEQPNYFLYLQVDPQTIDVNIHPTKTEIKFENEQAIWQIISAAIKESLGKFNAVPSIDFDMADAPDIPLFAGDTRPVVPPSTGARPYNPFKENASLAKEVVQDWQKLYTRFEQGDKIPDEAPLIEGQIPSSLNLNRQPSSETLFQRTSEASTTSESHSHGGDCFQLKGRYIFSPVKSGILCIDQHRAHVRILFDRYICQMALNPLSSQRLLFPQMMQLTPTEELLYQTHADTLMRLGFDLSFLGSGSYAINGIPAGSEGIDAVQTLRQMLACAAEEGNPEVEHRETLALTLARSVAIPYGQVLSQEEMEHIIDDLFASATPNYTPDGKSVLTLLSDDELSKRFR